LSASQAFQSRSNGSLIVNDAFENVDVRFKDDKAFLDYSTLCKVEWRNYLSDKSWYCEIRRKMISLYKKTGAINLIVMAKRLNNQSTAECLKQIIQVNKLQSGMDQIDVKDAWCNLMGNGVNSYTKMLCCSTLYVELSSLYYAKISHGKTKMWRW
jgi:hypothetical protein